MARPTSGWTLRLPPDQHVYLVRFSHAGRRVERSTGERTREGAAKAASRIYSSIVLGVATPAQASAASLDVLLAGWLEEYAVGHAAGTAENAAGYGRQFVARELQLSAPGYASYMRERIGQVSRSTLRKELSALRQFVAWCNDEPRSMALPAVPGLPKRGHPGVRGKNARKRAASILSAAEVARTLACVPPAYRPFFTVCWETSLRPLSTVARLEAPLHWPGGARLFVAREIDKAKYERTVPLTPAARAALLATGVREGALFPDITKDGARWAWQTALKRAGLASKKAGMYDLRHSRISHWANAPGAVLTGVAFLAGHKHISTTALYVRAKEEAAAAVLALGAPPQPPEPASLGEPQRASNY